VFGLWSGLMPRLVGEVSLVAIASTSTFLINTYLLHDKEFKKYTHQFTNFVAQSLTYPFQVKLKYKDFILCMLPVRYSECAASYSHPNRLNLLQSTVKAFVLTN
jgi:hypothetical protein